MLLALLLLMQGGQATNVRHGSMLPTKCTASAQIFILDAGQLYYCSATDTWTALAAGGGSGTVTTTGSPANGNLAKFSGATSVTNGDLTGDVTTSGTVATTLANNAVTAAKILNGTITYDKLQNVSANSKLLGSGASGSGAPPSELTVGSGLMMSGTTLSATGSGSGTVTNVATTSPITGGPITNTGTIACATCTTSASALTAGRVLYGAGSQAITTDSGFYRDITNGTNRYGLNIADVTGATNNYVFNGGKGAFQILNSDPDWYGTGAMFYNGGISGQNYEIRMGQLVSGGDDPLGYFDLWVHDDVSASYVTTVPGAHQAAFRGTKVVQDTNSGDFYGVHGTVGTGTGEMGTTAGERVGVFGESDFSGYLSGTMSSMGGVLGSVTVGDLGQPTGTIDYLFGTAGYIEYVQSSNVITINNAAALWARSPESDETITNVYGLKVDDVAVGTNRYAISTGAGDVVLGTLTSTGAATGKKVVCVDTATGKLYASSTGVDCSN